MDIFFWSCSSTKKFFASSRADYISQSNQFHFLKDTCLTKQRNFFTGSYFLGKNYLIRDEWIGVNWSYVKIVTGIQGKLEMKLLLKVETRKIGIKLHQIEWEKYC